MNKGLKKVLNGDQGNSLFPFFLVPTQVSPEVLRRDLRRLAANGVKGVCIEPNGNRNFAGPGWWAQMDAIMEEARALQMRVWLQDEPNFPTGNANHAASDHPELQKVYLEEQHIDAAGPRKGASFLVGNYLDGNGFMFFLQHAGAHGLSDPSKADPDAGDKKADPPSGGKTWNKGPKLLRICACRKIGGSELDGRFLDLTDLLTDGILNWDVPEGQWRIFIIYTLQIGKGRPDYLNLIDGNAVKLLIEKLYKPHYERYASDFGKTFAGFFSDEPEFGNIYGYANDNAIGRKIMPLPWSEEAGEWMLTELGNEAFSLLPALWYASGEQTARVRYVYMDILTRLFEKNFSLQIGDWCRARQCEYIGHMVEDMGNHARLGCGVGHYFRAMTGQDYAGIDLVLQQIRPGLDDSGLAWLGGDEGGEFFHYGLAKLGSSFAHMDPKKKGRSICEIFAAYGYSLGLKDQKWLFDHMLVRGINHFIPAWKTKTPPAEGTSRYDGDAQFRYNPLLAAYVNRLCSLFQDGVHVAPVAVLYHAEAEWCGDSMPFEKPVRVLAQRQIDCDVLPADVFTQREHFLSSLDAQGLHVNGETYKALVIPYAACIPASVAEFVTECAQWSFPVYFVDGMPEKIASGMSRPVCEAVQSLLPHGRVIPLGDLAGTLLREEIFEVRTSEEQTGLRYYHYHHTDSDLYLFFNEDPTREIRTRVEIPNDMPACFYDAFSNRMRPASTSIQDGKTMLELALFPYQSTVVMFSGSEVCQDKMPLYDHLNKSMTLEAPWKLSLARGSEPNAFVPREVVSSLMNVTASGNDPDFSGIMRYETDFMLKNVPETAILLLGEVFEVVEVWVNGRSAGARICQPYHFDLSGLLKTGENALRVEVINTLVHEMKDQFSQFAMVEPSGLLGPVTIRY